MNPPTGRVVWYFDEGADTLASNRYIHAGAGFDPARRYRSKRTKPAAEAALRRDFEERLAECGPLAFRVAYMDVGSNIDFGIRTTTDDRYYLYMIFERSALYPSTPDDKLPSRTPGQPPLVRQFKASKNMILKDGQTSESVVSTDLLNGYSLHISVTINLVK